MVVPGGMCVFTTWGSRFLTRLQKEAAEQEAGRQIHWYSSVVLAAAGSIEKRIEEYERGNSSGLPADSRRFTERRSSANVPSSISSLNNRCRSRWSHSTRPPWVRMPLFCSDCDLSADLPARIPAPYGFRGSVTQSEIGLTVIFWR